MNPVISDRSIVTDRDHLDHYYDSDETHLSITINNENPDVDVRNIDWNQKTFSSHPEFKMYTGEKIQK